jgi:adenine-specific DNA-methyltransferase
MRKLTAEDAETKSPDIVAQNIERLKEIFPEAFGEGKVDFDVLKQLLGGAIDERDEKYGLNWHGKRRARQLALTPSTGTLRPSPEDSVDWETTQNLMIEGDNLEVLKLLQKSYAGKVRLIYIDPPYNTGNDFVYPDDFRDNIRNYLELTGQLESGKKISSNTEASGRFHTDWLNMMYPRLRLARNLLRRDGVIFISLDDAEAPNLRLVCDSIFGAENFLAQIVWEGANKNDARQIGVCHEYALAYAHTRSAVPNEWGLAKEGVDAVLEEVERLRAKHKDDYEAASEDLAGWFRAMKAKSSFAHRRFRYIDQRGAYKEDDPTAPGGRRFDLRHPVTGKVIPLRHNRGWGFDQTEFERLVAEGRISFVTDKSIMVRRYLHETDKMTPQSVFYQPARSESERLARLMGANVFDFPKDVTILQKFVEMATDPSDPDCIVLDFFAGSGTTAEAVMAQNAAAGGNRRYILVQLPEPLDPTNNEQKPAANFCDQLGKPRNIAELTKERLRRTAKKVKQENPMFAGDLGFRVFKLASTNIREWDPDRDDLPKTLEESVEHLKTDRSGADILFEILLQLSLDLTVPIEDKTIAGKKVHSVGVGTLLACLAEKIDRKEIEPLAHGIVAWRRELDPAGETTVVFRDSAFDDDVAKTNIAAILEQNGFKRESIQSL